ncbi:MAG: acylphosphatase [Leptospirillum sp.]
MMSEISSGRPHFPTTAVSESITVSGHVHGVGYRAFVLSHALLLGLWGSVRNQEDKTVLVLVSGLPDAIDQLVLELQKGPFGSRVDCVLRTSLGIASETAGTFVIDRDI